VRNVPTVKLDADGHCPAGDCGSHFGVAESTASMHLLGGLLKGLATSIINAIPKAYNAGASLVNAQIENGSQRDVPQLPLAPTLPVTGPAEAIGNAVGELGMIVAGGAKSGAAADGESAAARVEGAANKGGSSAIVPESIPAGPGARPSPSQQGAINQMGDTHGCSTCGTKTPGTTSGNWVGDHQPPTALNKNGGPQVYKPQCLQCSRQQGGQVSAAVKAAKKQSQTQ
jgi:hypothetical protein